jgi:hypothetical protein
LNRFLDLTPRRSLEAIRSIHLLWRGKGAKVLAPGPVHPLDPSVHSDVPSWPRMRAWSNVWSQVLRRCERLSNVRIWYYGRLPRFSMPEHELAALGRLFSARPGVHVSAHLVWTWETGVMRMNGAEVVDDGSLIPDELRDLGFPVTRTPPIAVGGTGEHEDVWTSCWRRPENVHLLKILGRRDVDVHRGWGVRHCGPRQASWLSPGNRLQPSDGERPV